MCSKGFRWNPSTCTSQNSGYLKRIVNYIVTVYDEIKVSWKWANINNINEYQYMWQILYQEMSRVLFPYILMIEKLDVKWIVILRTIFNY